MARIGPFVIDFKGGAYCQITLDSGERLIVNHEKTGLDGGCLTIEIPTGFRSDRIFTVDLDSPEGKAVVDRLIREAQPGSVRASPFGALVEYVKDSTSAAEAKTLCAMLTSTA
jgi:hypothetical protein